VDELMKGKLLIVLLVCILTSSAIKAQEQRGIIRWVSDGEVKDAQLYDGSYALVIGMSDYKFWPKLPGTRADVEDVKNILVEHKFKVEVALDLNSDELEKKIKDFVNTYGLDGHHRLLVYFAGHGHTMMVQDGRSPGYIVPIDAPRPEKDPVLFRQKALAMTTVKEWAERITTRHSLFVFDSCFSGILTMRSDGSGIPPVIQKSLDNPARQFITAGSAGQQVPDVSIFKRYFVAGLRGEADLDRDGYITGTELFNYVHNKVTNESNARQTPQYGTLENENLRFGDMVFSRTVDAENTSYEKAWEDAQAKNTSGDYNIFLNSYPDGKYKNAALNAFKAAVHREVAAKPPQTQPAAGLDQQAQPVAVFRRAPLTPKPHDFDTVEISSEGVVSARHTMSRDSITEELGDEVTMTLVEIRGDTFKMGSQTNADDEKPVHDVTVPGFYMSIVEVTQEQWAAVAKMPKVKIALRKNPWEDPIGPNLPAVNITWEEAVEFCERLSAHTERIYSLPSEAEWEFAARAGKDTAFAFGQKITDGTVNFAAAVTAREGVKGVSRNRMIDVGSLQAANGYGLYDMHGNAAEWCDDDYVSSYKGAPVDGSARRGGAVKKVVRGGSYASTAARVCSTCRAGSELADRTIGFRVVMRSPVLTEKH
jgi:formylglycine-generating enzyme required for sulfatase activity/uncharacterized caspase-like protein